MFTRTKGSQLLKGKVSDFPNQGYSQGRQQQKL